MFSTEQLALLNTVKTHSAEQCWADNARTAVDAFQQDLFASRCAASKRNLSSLDELGAAAPLGRFGVSLCPLHGVFHLYDEVRALTLANTVAVAVQSRIDTAAAELDVSETKRLRGRVLFARDAFYKAIKADTAAIATYRKFGMATTVPPGATGTSCAKPHVSTAPVARRLPGGAHGPLAARGGRAACIKAEIGITDSQLIEFYRCFRKKPYSTVAAAVNATMLVHEKFDTMRVYLCGHCSNLHIGHMSNQGTALTPAFFDRAMTKWRESPAVAARFLAMKTTITI